MSKYVIIILLLTSTPRAFAIFDFVAEKADDVAKSAALAEDFTDLVSEIDKDTSLNQASRELTKKSKDLTETISKTRSSAKETIEILEGPKLAQKNLNENIRATTAYIRRARSLLAKFGVLGSAGVTTAAAVNSAATLNDIRANQAMHLAIQQRAVIDAEILRIKKEEDTRNFILKERQAIRNLWNPKGKK